MRAQGQVGHSLKLISVLRQRPDSQVGYRNDQLDLVLASKLQHCSDETRRILGRNWISCAQPGVAREFGGCIATLMRAHRDPMFCPA